MPQDIATGSPRIRAVVLVSRPDFGRCALAVRSPTALWPVLNETSLELLLRRLAAEGIEDMVVCCGQDAAADVEPVCRRFGSATRVLTEGLAAGTAGCLRDAVADSPADVIIVFSGSIDRFLYCRHGIYAGIRLCGNINDNWFGSCLRLATQAEH
jgi:hypothetical protein